MRLHRFYIEGPIEEDMVRIRDTGLVHQLAHVFRYQVGTQILLFNNSGYEYQAIIQELSNREVVCEILSKKKGVTPDKDIWLFLALIKKDRFELAVEKATELGVSHIVPVKAERSVSMNIKAERLETIVREASEQCGRSDMPVIHDVVSFGEACELIEKESIAAIMFDPGGEPLETLPINLYDRAALFIGPEGGWTKTELMESNAKIFSLGKFILRAETAVIAVLAQFL